ncbi:MAG: site-2 protease family protein [bacterium]
MQILTAAVPILIALTIHEVSHGWVANYFGDDTARRMGRLSLNPIKHLDPMGTLVFVITRMIGWAKPVPIDFRRLRHPKQDMIWVALAGPASNLVLAAFSARLFHLLAGIPGVYAWGALRIMLKMCVLSVQINIALAIFNLVPILPLDGGRILTGLLPREYAVRYAQLERYGMFLILLFVVTDSFQRFLVPVIISLYRIFIGI